MNLDKIARFFGFQAIIGGATRVVSSFIPWSPNNDWLEAFYFFVDINLLFGLIGYYLANAERLGRTGFVAFLIAATGIVLIIGPDGTSFGIDIYQAGVAIIALGISVFSINFLLRGASSMFAPAIWLISIVAVFFGAAAGFTDQAFALGGVFFGFGFIFAGVSLLQRRY